MRIKNFVTIGITGSIAIGKSTSARILQKLLNCPLFECDQFVHRLYDTNKDVFAWVLVNAPQAIEKDHKINRRLLASIILQHNYLKKSLETLLHQLVIHETIRLKKYYKSQGWQHMIVDIPLLFEAHQDKYYDVIIALSCLPSTQNKRLLQRDKHKLELFLKLKQTQLPDIYKQNWCDHILYSGLGKRFVYNQFSAMIREGVFDLNKRTTPLQEKNNNKIKYHARNRTRHRNDWARSPQRRSYR